MTIRWPERYDPRRAPVHVRNERAVAASAEVVWAWLARAERWPEWYPNASQVRILRGARGELALGTQFRWRTFGVGIRSEVVECEPPQRLAWNARGIGVDAYHAWWIEAQGSACRVLTEETQYGAVAQLGARLFPQRMWRGHELWLERLAEQARAGSQG